MMDIERMRAMEKGAAAAYHCPRWNELPSLELYMDQALIVIEEAVRPLLPPQETAATATMRDIF